jgi:hypothetical protein
MSDDMPNYADCPPPPGTPCSPPQCPDEVPAPEVTTVSPSTIENVFTGIVFIPFIQQMINNKRIPFIKEVRAATGLDLKEAKDLADKIFAQFTFPTQADSWVVRNAEQLQRDNEALRRTLVGRDQAIRDLEDQRDQYRNECLRLEHVKEELEEEAQEQRKYITELVTLVDSYKKVLKDTIINSSSD